MPAPTTPPAQERRRFRRVALGTPVIVVCAAEVKTCRTRDICPGGIFVYDERPPALGERVQVEFKLASNRHFALSGRVARHDRGADRLSGTGFAVIFEASNEVEEDIQAAILEVVRQESAARS